MQRFILIRILQSIIAIIVVSLVVFMLTRLSGDPVMLLIDPYATEVEINALRVKLGLDKSYPEQYFTFMANALRGDFGRSIWYQMPAIDAVMERLPDTIILSSTALLFSLLIAIPTGVLSAVKKNSWLDRLGKTFALVGQSAPIFWCRPSAIMGHFPLLKPYSFQGGISSLWGSRLTSI